MGSSRRLGEGFVRLYNEPGAPVYPLSGDEVDWIEMPTGRRGGRKELFDALREFCTNFDAMKLEVLSIVADEHEAVLESALSARWLADASILRARTLWFLTSADGKIVKEHDYSCIQR